MLFSTSFLHPGTIFKASAARRVEGYDERYSTAQDYDLWSRMIFLGEVGTVPAVLMKYRENPRGNSAVCRAEQVSNASSIAATYAENLNIGISRQEWYAFHRFLVAGEHDADMSARDMYARFRFAYDKYYASCRGDARFEVNRVAAEFAQILAWRIRSLLGSNSSGLISRCRVGVAYASTRYLLSRIKRFKVAVQAE